jgi:dolichyl-phosphate-mannose-protein mannosyltransferase
MEVIEYSGWAIVHLGALGLMLLCAAGMGNLFLRKCRFQNLAERIVFTTAAGLGLCAIVLFVLGLLRMLYQPVIQVLTTAGAIATVLSFLYSYKRSRSNKHSVEHSLGVHEHKQNLSNWHRKDFYTRRRVVTGLLMLLAVGYWVVLMMAAQYPPVLWDSISQHLIVAREFLAQHRLVVLLGIPQPILPALNHMLFTWALALQDDILAQMVEHTFSMLTAVGIYAWGKRQAQGAMGFTAAALWLAHPLVRLLSKSAYVDIAITCFVFLGIYALRLFWDHRDVRWWYLGMALLAMGAGVKLPGFFFLGIATLFGLWVMMRPYVRSLRPGRAKEDYEYGAEEHRFTWKPLILGGTVALLILIPWYGFIGYVTGNPLWPAAAQYSTGVWGAPWIVSDVNRLLNSGARQATLGNFLTLSIDWLRHPERFNAELGHSLFPLIVIWPLAWIVAIFNRSVRWWTLWALAFTVFWFLQAPLLRYWLPVLPIAGLALCESLQWIMKRIPRLANFRNTAWVSAGVLLLLWSGRTVYSELNVRGLPPVTPVARERFLTELGGYMGVEYVNAHAKNDDTVCVLSASWMNYYFNQHVIDLRGALFQNRKPTFRWPDDQEWMEWLESEDVNWIFIYYRTPELTIPKRNPVLDPYWPGYQLVYADSLIWVFHRE